MTELLEVSGLRASYGLGPVLTDVSLKVQEGMVFGVVGPNGHGKTSLLRAVSGLMPQRSGSIRFAGMALEGWKPERIARTGIIHVPQGDLVYRKMTVLENLLVGGSANASGAQTGRQLESVLALFPKLRERLGQVASSLSGGERRMLGIGRGLMMADARLLMLDEPSLGLAPIVIDQIYEALSDLAARGMTILVVEENVSRISAIAGSLALLNHGRLVWSGPPDDLSRRSELREAYLGL